MSQTHIALPLLVSIRFQDLFTPLIGVLFTFPSRYSFTIGRQGVFRLGRRSSHIQTGFHVSRPTRRAPLKHLFAYRTITAYGRPFQSCSTKMFSVDDAGLLRFRSPLLTESRLISFPTGTEMFQFPAFASCAYLFSTG